jgi:glycosyltransferase involved in cell wall biosynthesis
MISVVIPVYNRSQELRRALDSLLRQTFTEFEVLVCDDGSTEDIAAVVDEYRNRLDIHFQRIVNSGGPARPRNHAITLARYPWIAFLDSDDWWMEQRLATIAPLLDNDVDLLYHPLQVVTEAGLTRVPERRAVIGTAMSCAPLRYMMCFGNPLPNSAVVVRKELLREIGGINEDLQLVAEDFDTWLCLVEHGARVHFVDQVLGFYWVGKDGISSFSRRQLDGQIALFERHLPRLPLELRPDAQACHDFTVGSLALQLGDLTMARDHLWRAKHLPLWSLRAKRWLKLARVLLREWRG